MIGIFDSGIGGLTVVRALKKKKPDVSFVYLGDTARSPYGTKSPETVRRYSEEAIAFLVEKGAKAVIVACNTASSLAADHLRGKFPDLPIFEVVSPAVQAALEATTKGKIGVIGTRATIASGVYEKRLKSNNPSIIVVSNPAPLLVSLVEEGWINTPETASIASKYLEPLRKRKVDTLILGCTHYPVIKPVLAEIMGDGVRLIDSADAVAATFCATIENDANLYGLLHDAAPSSAYYVTDPSASFASVASEWLGEPVAVLKASL